MSSSRLMNSGLKWVSAPCRAARDVGGHDQDDVLEVHRPALAVGEPPVVHDLQEDVEDVGVGLLDLVEEHDGVRAPAHGLGQLAALVVADVAGGRADEARHGVLLHVLAHVDADHRVLRVEHELGQRAGQLGLADAGRAEEQERADRPVRVAQAGARAPQGVGHRLDGGLLAHDAPVQALLHVDELGDLALHEPRHRDAGPATDDLGDVLGRDLLLEEAGVAVGALLGRGEAPLELGDLAVAQLGRTLQVGLALGALGLAVRLLEALLDLLDADDGVLLGLPLRLHAVGGLAQLGELAVQRLAALGGRVVALVLERRALDLQLHDAALDLVDLLGERVDLDAQARAGLVDEVDGLVGQEAVGDVAVRQRRGGDERGVLDADAVVHLVALLEAAQDRDRVLDGGLADVDGLEAALERGVLLDVLAVLVEGGRADRAQLAAGEHRLEQVGGVDGALRGARADDGVQLVHEEDDLALRVLDVLEDRLQALLELAAVLRPGEQGADVERDDPAVAQRLGHVAGDDALGEALDDGGLADAGVADEDGVVLAAAGEDLDDAADLVVTADHRVELALRGLLGEVAAEALERVDLLLGALVGHAVAAADLGDAPAAARPSTRRRRAAPRRPSSCARRARAGGARWTRTRP